MQVRAHRAAESALPRPAPTNLDYCFGPEVAKQVGQCRLEGNRQALQAVEPGVPSAALNSADVGGVEPGALSQRLLGQAQRFPAALHALAEGCT